MQVGGIINNDTLPRVIIATVCRIFDLISKYLLYDIWPHGRSNIDDKAKEFFILSQFTLTNM